MPYIGKEIKEGPIIKYVTMINPVTGWFKFSRNDAKLTITTTNLFETTWLTRNPWTTEITYDQGSEFVGHESRK